MTIRTGKLELAMRAGLLPLALLFAFLPSAGQSLLDIPCLFDSLLGHECIGCGMKSAVAAALSGGVSGGWQRASSINPLAPAVTALLAGISANAWYNIWKRGI